MPASDDPPFLSVLLVEDEADIRTVVEMALRREADFRVTTCIFGEQAIAFVERTNAAFDVALINVMLPDMHGADLVSVLRRQPATRDATILFVTAYIPPGGVEAYRMTDVDGIITKPFDVLDLAGTIRSEHARRSASRRG